MRVTDKILFVMRNFLARDMFTVMRRYVRGRVLDVGGWDFFLYAQERGVAFDHWTTLENSEDRGTSITNPKFELVHGDGCNMSFPNASFDSVLNIQVLEHVFEPIKMVSEISRVLKTGGYAVFLVPQTANLHMAPHHYCNFTRYWLIEVCRRNRLEIVDLRPQGGAWTTIASRLFYFFLQAARAKGRTPKEYKRNVFFYLLYPLMAITALIGLPWCLFLALGDLKEEATNHLLVARKTEELGE